MEERKTKEDKRSKEKIYIYKFRLLIFKNKIPIRNNETINVCTSIPVTFMQIINLLKYRKASWESQTLARVTGSVSENCIRKHTHTSNNERMIRRKRKVTESRK